MDTRVLILTQQILPHCRDNRQQMIPKQPCILLFKNGKQAVQNLSVSV